MNTDETETVKKPRKNIRVPPHPQEVWVKAWCHVAIGTACKTPEVASQWADHAMNEYIKRWPWNKEDNISILPVEPVEIKKK